MLKSTLFVALLVLSRSDTSLAAPGQNLVPRSAGVCGNGIYGELATILAGYPIAQAFCCAMCPVECTTAKAAKRMALVNLRRTRMSDES